MASVQVRILQSGRTDAYGLPLIPGSVVTVDRDYAVGLIYAGFASWVNPADAYDGETNLRKPSESYTLFQSGIPFVIFAGDGGSNGLSFSGTRGVFTLSAAVLTSFWNILSAGGYAYMPAGAGGLPAGWYWCVMTGDTAGEIFSEMYTVGSGKPAFIASPTTLPNCTAGYITQPAAEVVAVSFAFPGGSVGPNGILRGMVAQRTNNSAGAKIFRLKIGTTALQTASATTSNCDVDWEFVRQNAGVQTTQIGNRNSSGWLGSSSTTYSGDKTALDLSVDQTITFTISRDTVTDSALGILREFTVKYGA